MADFWTWDAATWQSWAAMNWPWIVLAAAGLVLLIALASGPRRGRDVHRPATRRGEFAGAMPDRPLGAANDGRPMLPERRADVLAAIDNDYATGRIDRLEWERRRRELL